MTNKNLTENLNDWFHLFLPDLSKLFVFGLKIIDII